MRLAYLTTAVAEPDALRGGPFDAGSLLDLAGDHDITVMADESTPAVDRLRAAGLRVHVSDKRTTRLPHGVLASADAIQARLLAQWHRAAPFDLLAYSAERPADLALDESSLAGIPRAAVLDAGPLLTSRMIMETPELARAHGRHAWLAAGFTAGSDIVIADAPPAAYGLREAGLPPWRSVYALPEPARPSQTPPHLLAVVATTEDLAGLATVSRRALEAVAVGEATTVVIVHAALRGAEDRIRTILGDAVPARMRGATVLVPADDGQGVGGAFLARADAIVCARASDLVLPAVRERAAQVPTVVLDGDLRQAPAFTSELPGVRAPARTVTAPVPSGRLAGVTDLLDRLEDDDAADMIVLHHPDYADEAARLARAPRVGTADLAVMSRPRLPYGDGDAVRACRHLIAVHRRLWPSLRPLLRDAPTLAHVVVPGLDLSHTDALNLMVVPGRADGCGRLRDGEDYWSSVWMAGNGVLPRARLGADAAARLEQFARKRSDGDGATGESAPDRGGSAAPHRTADRPRPGALMPRGALGLREWVKDQRWPRRARLALPWRFGLLGRVLADDGPDALPPAVKAWAKDHGWTDRARLALPWRFGLLPRAMRGRWG